MSSTPNITASMVAQLYQLAPTHPTVAAQLLAKLQDVLSPTVPNDQQVELLHKKMEAIARIFNVYQVDITCDHLKFFKLKDIINLGKTILLLLPLREASVKAKSALLTFFSNERNEKGLYEEFWKNCGVSAQNQGHYGSSLAEIQALEKYQDFAEKSLASTLPSQSQSQTNLQLVAALAKELSQFVEPIWANLHQDLNKEIISQQETIKNADAAKRHLIGVVRAAKTSGKVYKVEFGLVESTFNFCSRQLKYLHHITTNKIPKLKFLCTHLDLSFPSASRQVETLLLLGKNFLQQVNKTNEQLVEKLASYEGAMALTSGVDTRSIAALRYLKTIKKSLDEIQTKLWINLRDRVTDLKNSLNAEVLNSQINQEQRAEFFRSIVYTLIDNGTLRAELNKAFETIIIEYSKERESICKKLHPLFFALYHEETLTQHAMRDQIMQFLDLIPEAQKHLEEEELKGRDSINISNFLELIEGYFHYTLPREDFIQPFQAWINKFKSDLQKDNKAKIEAGLPYTSPTLSAKEVRRVEEMAMKVQRLNQSVIALCGRVFPALEAVRTTAAQVKEKESSLKLDSFLYTLKLEEQAALANRFSAAAAQEHKIERSETRPESPVTAATATAAAPGRALVESEMPLPTPVCVQSATAKLAFDLLHYLKTWHGMQTLPPARIAFEADRPTQARHQQIYFLNCLANVLELLDRRPTSALVQFACLFGHLSLEQGLTERHLRAFPNGFLSHSLREMLEDLGIRIGSNPWTDEDCGTLAHRYAWNMTGGLSFALRHIRENHPKTTDEFCEKRSKWMEGAAQFNIEVLSHGCPAEKQALLKRIQSVLEVFGKNTSTANKASVEEHAKNALPRAHVLTEWEGKLKKSISAIDASIKAHAAGEVPYLFNARNHLLNLIAAINLFKQYPQQAFLHVHLQMMLISAQYFAENLGIHLSQWVDHSLYSYGLEEGLKKEEEATLKIINVEKGSEYPYSYFAYNRTPSALMRILSDLYAQSFEAQFLGDGAVPSGMAAKSHAELQTTVSDLAIRFARLAQALVQKHLSE